MSDTARVDVEYLLMSVLGCQRTYLYSRPEAHLSEAQHTQFLAQLARREQGEPIAYIVGSQAFWTLELNVAPCTLIPRSETELLVELALDKAGSEARILDLGTGTGAVALSLAAELPQAHVEAVDVHSDAVTLAQANAAKHQLARAHIYQSDWFEQVQGRFDVIVSNPPYIEHADPHLERGDLRFEPSLALVSGADGLDAIRAIVTHAPQYLMDDAWLMMEHGWNQGEAVRQLLLNAGFKAVTTHCDYAGHERVTMGLWP